MLLQKSSTLIIKPKPETLWRHAQESDDLAVYPVFGISARGAGQATETQESGGG